uniref:DUF222 domain-containing protein n=1 Tax=Microbacterium indicum TaxID=358100 RepID=UPI00048BFD06
MTSRPSSPYAVAPTAEEAARTAELLRVLEASKAAERAEQALQAQALAELGEIAHAQSRRSDSGGHHDFPRRAMAAEVAALTQVSPRVARNSLENSRILVSGFPRAFDALAGGRISQEHVDAIVDAGIPLLQDPGALSAFDDHAVDIAEGETPHRLRSALSVLVEKAQPMSAREKHEKAREGRGVWVYDMQNGMSELTLRSTTLEVHAVYDRVTGMGRAVKRDRRAYARARDEAQGSGAPAPAASAPSADAVLSDERTLPQLRADILTDLLLSAAPTGHRLHQAGSTATLGEIRATVQVTIPADVLAGRDDGPPAWIGAGSVISPAQARILAGDSPGWERLFVRPDTGDIVQTDHYRPTTGQVRAL